jgi:hypothetical protein
LKLQANGRVAAVQSYWRAWWQDTGKTAAFSAVDVSQGGTSYQADNWEYHLGTDSSGHKNGFLFYKGNDLGGDLTQDNVNDYYETPWGRLYWHGTLTPMHDSRWMPYPDNQVDRKGRLIAFPGIALPPRPMQTTQPDYPFLTPQQRPLKAKEALDEAMDKKDRFYATWGLAISGYTPQSAETLGIIAADSKYETTLRGYAAMGLDNFTREMSVDERRAIQDKLYVALETEKDKLPDGVIRTLIKWGDADRIRKALGDKLRGHKMEIDVLQEISSRDDALARLWELYETAPAVIGKDGWTKRSCIGVALIHWKDKRGIDVLLECLTVKAPWPTDDTSLRAKESNTSLFNQSMHDTFAIVSRTVNEDFGYDCNGNWKPQLAEVIPQMDQWWQVNRQTWSFERKAFCKQTQTSTAPSATQMDAISLTPQSASRPASSSAKSASLTDEALMAMIKQALPGEMIAPMAEIVLPGGIKARTVVLREVYWHQPFLSFVQMPRSDYTHLPDAERLKHEYRFEDHIQLWLVPLDGNSAPGAEIKDSLAKPTQPHRCFRETAFMGTGNGYAWYACSPIFTWVQAQRKLALTGGDDPVAAAARGMFIREETAAATSAQGIVEVTEPWTSSRCWVIFGEAGQLAIPYIDKAIAAKDARAFEMMIFELKRSKDPKVTQWLVGKAKSEDMLVCQAAQRALVESPRKEAAAEYAAWLEETLSTGESKMIVTQEQILLACMEAPAPGIQKILARVMEAPQSIGAYTTAFMFDRQLAGRPIPPTLLAAQGQIEAWATSGRTLDTRADDAIQTLVTSDDPDAAAAIALQLSMKQTKGDDKPANAIGRYILLNLPDGKGRKLAALVTKPYGPSDPLIDALRAVSTGTSAATTQASSAATQAVSQPASPAKATVDDLMQAVRQNKPGMRSVDIVKLYGDSVISTAEEYVKDPNFDVRLNAYMMMQQAALGSKNLETRRHVVDVLLESAFSDTDKYYNVRLLDELRQKYRSEDFSERSKILLRAKLSATPDARIILVVGASGDTSQMEKLKEICDKAKEPLQPWKVFEKEENILAFAALRARARMGVKDDIASCIQIVDSCPNEDIQLILMDRLSYVRQPEVIEYINRYLNSDKYEPYAGEDVGRMTYAQRAMDALSNMLEDFPTRGEKKFTNLAELTASYQMKAKLLKV